MLTVITRHKLSCKLNILGCVVTSGPSLYVNMTAYFEGVKPQPFPLVYVLKHALKCCFQGIFSWARKERHVQGRKFEPRVFFTLFQNVPCR